MFINATSHLSKKFLTDCRGNPAPTRMLATKMVALKKGQARQFEPFVAATVMDQVRFILIDSFTQIFSFHNHLTSTYPLRRLTILASICPCLALWSYRIRQNATLCF
jgi:hypothetical protein